MSLNGEKPAKGKDMRPGYSLSRARFPRLERLRDASGVVKIQVQRPVIQKVMVSKTAKDLGLSAPRRPSSYVIQYYIRPTILV